MHGYEKSKNVLTLLNTETKTKFQIGPIGLNEEDISCVSSTTIDIMDINTSIISCPLEGASR